MGETKRERNLEFATGTAGVAYRRWPSCKRWVKKFDRIGAANQGFVAMKFGKIRFASDGDRVRAVGELMRQAKTVVLNDGMFIVPGPALSLLNGQRVAYTILQWLNQDDVHLALRNPLAHAV